MSRFLSAACWLEKTFALPGRTWEENTGAVIIYEKSGEKPVISCTLGFWGYSWNAPLYINKVFMMCGPHLQGCGQQAQSARGSYCEFWLPRTRWHQTATLLCAALCCHDRTRALGRGWLQAFHLVHRWRRFLRCILRTQSVALKASDLSWESRQLCASIFSAPFRLREKAGLRGADLWAFFSQCCSEKSWLSTPPGKFGDVRHIFITLVQYHTGQLIGKSWMFFFLPSLSSLTDKLVNCMCGIGRMSQCVDRHAWSGSRRIVLIFVSISWIRWHNKTKCYVFTAATDVL